MEKPAASVSTRLHPVIQGVFANHVHATQLGELAREVVEAQLKIYNASGSKANLDGVEELDPDYAPTSLFTRVAKKIASLLDDDPEEDRRLIHAIPESLTRRVIWRWHRLSYSSFCEALGILDADSRIDEWILCNERYLREKKSAHWTDDLVRLSKDADVVFIGSVVSSHTRTIDRPSFTPGDVDISGYTFLDQKREQSIRLQPSVSAFVAKFDEMSDGLLRGLDWENVCVAGGLALGALMSPNDIDATCPVPHASETSSNTPSSSSVHVQGNSSQWKHSDIDIYIHGLDPVQANAKIAQIFETFKSNLPAGAPALVVRNSKTITFFSKHPLRRVQIVLKRVQSPREVLLNFDLDICAVAWDGTEVWLLPRACRALQTGYNVFTMNLIYGHYLGDRRASQEQRVFKYAYKGFGIRILPAYVESLRNSEPPLNLLELAEYGRGWTDRIVTRYGEWNYHRDRRKLHNFGRRHLKATLYPEFKGAQLELPVFTHVLLDTREVGSENARPGSCLNGFELLMRHVRLWEKECAGELLIQDDLWASTTYDEVRVNLSYDDSPNYRWNETFTTGGLRYALDKFNVRERSGFWDTVRDGNSSGLTIRRCAYAESVEEVLGPECDILTGLWIPPSFLEFANKLSLEALEDHGIMAEPPLRELKLEPKGFDDDDGIHLVPVLWRISSLNMWQLLDRRLDEVYEALWAFRRANERLGAASGKNRLDIFKIQVARRALQHGKEYEEFAVWVAESPVNWGWWYPGPGQGFVTKAIEEFEPGMGRRRVGPPSPSDEEED